MNKEIEKIDIEALVEEVLENYSPYELTFTDQKIYLKLNELIEVVNSLIKDEEETKPKGKTK